MSAYWNQKLLFDRSIAAVWHDINHLPAVVASMLLTPFPTIGAEVDNINYEKNNQYQNQNYNVNTYVAQIYIRIISIDISTALMNEKSMHK